MKFFRNRLHPLACLIYLGVANFAFPASGQPAAPEKPKAQELVPEMVRIAPGDFEMGSPPEEDGRITSEGPRHRVTIKYSFEVGKYDVTRDEYAAFVSDTKRPDGASCDVHNGTAFHKTAGRGWRDPGFTQTGRDPVVCVSWDDARAYVKWLSGKTGKPYRLLSESEWEYAARAGTTTTYYWGDGVGSGNANCDGCGSQWDYKQTSPAGSFAPNAFGLYDMLGNVWQWTADCWNNSYIGAPGSGSSWQNGACGMRMLRGGSWAFDTLDTRVAFRYGEFAGFRSSSYGFRIARTL
jgi:formylglycine-generating enzyme required for sulfatase activity